MFLHPMMLAGLSLIAAPIIIHLLNRRRFRIQEWAAMEFLLEAIVKNRRRLRVENLVLLLLRILAIALLVAAVARPRIQGALGAFAGGDRTERIVILDDSFSMAYEVGTRSAFDRAREAALGLLDLFRGSDAFTLIRTSQVKLPDYDGSPISSERVEQIRKKLGEMRPSSTPSLLLEAVQEAVSKAEKNKELGRKALYVVTDLRRVDFQDLEAMKQALEKLPKDKAQATFVDAGFPDSENLAITDFAPSKRNVVKDVPLRFTATVRNFGPVGSPPVTVTLKGPHSNPSVETVPIPAGGAVEASFPAYVFRDTGSFALSAQLRPGRKELAPDNERFLSVTVRESIEVLLVNGEPGPYEFDNETAYLVRALAPPGEAQTGIRPTIVDDRTFEVTDLSRFDAVFLCNVYRIPTSRADALEKFVAGGGGLVIFLGDLCDPANLNTELGKAGKGLLPLYIGERREAPRDKPMRLKAGSFTHSVMEGFAGTDNLFALTLNFYQHYRLVPPPGEREFPKETARMGEIEGDVESEPLIVEKPFGKGHVILVGTAADREWSNWPVDINAFYYLPFVQEATRFLARPAFGDRNLLVGNPFTRPLDPSKFSREAVIATPGLEGKEHRVQAGARAGEKGAEGFEFRFDRTFAPGLYKVKLKDAQGRDVEESFAVNVDTRESDMARIGEQEIQAGLNPVKVFFVKDVKLLKKEEEGSGTELWRSILWILLPLLVVESLLARRFSAEGV